ncbi:hypothetical protein H0H81_008357 [Sphagnurus paluster]|uniref:Beta-glucuronidase C-terminal domain-containing protein n=1 Tax=Sphagnurus paluster TaxID=117069 RepID=A0A9P7GQ96_9AGAR|nr:hypothetical protein H0H81_008357 [Sphagnurus paluster]
MDRWTDWIGTTSRNEFFFNTLDNLKQITGKPPQIRVGANSEDRTNFQQDIQFAQAIFPPPTAVVPYPETTSMLVGDSYYATTRFLPPGTRVTWGVNFGTYNITAAVLQTRSIVGAFASPEIRDAGIVLDYLEIGNEPDLYRNNGLRLSNYSTTQWVGEWLTFAKEVAAAGGLSANSHTKFIGGSFAGAGHSAGFYPQAAFDAGLLTGPGKLISAQGAPGVSNTAGAALWTLDYALFAAQLRISSVFFHVGIGFKYSLIQPATLDRSILDGSPLPEPIAPHVQPQYYAAIIAAEAIGNTGDAKILEINIDHPRISGYAFYENDRLVRAVLINSKAFLPESTSRSSIHIDLGFASPVVAGFEKMKVKRLVINRATDPSGLTWGGQTYETSDGRVNGVLNEETKSIAEGVDIKDTEAILLKFY